MAIRKRGLGRGLDALLGGSSDAKPAVETSAETVSTAAADDVAVASSPEVARAPDLLPVDLIGRSPYQPRTEFDAQSLQELADSILTQGIIQPIVVRPLKDGNYELIAGERRWRAAQLAGLHEVPIVVRDVPDQTAMAMALIENIQREELGPLEEAGALKRLHEDFGLTHQQVAEAVGRSRASVSNLMRLLELQADVLDLLSNKTLDMGHGKALLGLEGVIQSEAAAIVASRGLSVRETERLVKRMREPTEVKPKAEPKVDPDVQRLEQSLTDKLGCPVSIKSGRGGQGRVMIDYTSLEELEGVLAHIQ